MKKIIAMLSVLSLALLASCGTETDMSGENGTNGEEDIIIDMEENNTTEDDTTSDDTMMEEDTTSADETMEDDSDVDGEEELDIVM